MGGSASKAEEKPAAPAPSLEKTSETLDAKIAQLDRSIEKCEAEAKSLIAKQATQPTAKARAMQQLKMKKMYEQQRDQLLGTQFNVANMQIQTEQAKVTHTAVEAMKAATADLKKQQEKVDVDQVHDLMDQQQELAQDMADIQAALSQAPNSDLDADAEAELAAMYAQQEEENVASILAHGGASSVPAAATPAAGYAAPAAPAAAQPAAPLPA